MAKYILYCIIIFLVFFLQLSVYSQELKEVNPRGVWWFEQHTDKLKIESMIVITGRGIFGMNTEVVNGKAKNNIYSQGIWFTSENEPNKVVLAICEVKPYNVKGRIDLSMVPSILNVDLYGEKELLLTNKLMRRRYRKVR
jgi:hypothetical protein